VLFRAPEDSSMTVCLRVGIVVGSLLAVAGCAREDESLESPPTGSPELVAGNECDFGTAETHLGQAVVLADFDGDGDDEIVAGGPEDDGARGVVCAFGLAGADPFDPGIPIYQEDAGKGGQVGDDFGWSLAAGDFNGDGDADLAVGAPGEGVFLGEARGMVAIFPGSATGFAAGAVINDPAGPDGPQNGARFGWALAAGDYDCDGYDDLAVGSPRRDVDGASAAGAVYLYQGNPAKDTDASALAGVGRIDQEMLDGLSEDGDRFGSTVAFGNFRNMHRVVLPDGIVHGCDDLAIGAPREDVEPEKGESEASDAGAVFVATAPATLFTTFPAESTILTERPRGRIEARDEFGASLAVGDFDGDGAADLAVGAPHEDFRASDDGAVFVFFGQLSDGLGTDGAQLLTQPTSVGVPADGVEEDGDRFGSALAAGAFDQDGFDDLAISSPHDDYLTGDFEYLFEIRIGLERTNENAGLVFMRFGSASGFGASPDDYLMGHLGVDTMFDGDKLGETSMATGDINSDGISDLVIGAPRKNMTVADQGRIYIAQSDASAIEDPGTCGFASWSGHYDATFSAFDSAAVAAGATCDASLAPVTLAPEEIAEGGMSTIDATLELEQTSCGSVRGWLYALGGLEANAGFESCGGGGGPCECNEVGPMDVDVPPSVDACNYISIVATMVDGDSLQGEGTFPGFPAKLPFTATRAADGSITVTLDSTGTGFCYCIVGAVAPSSGAPIVPGC
jgi:hypothetical protein